MACLNPFLIRDMSEIKSVPCGRCINCVIARSYQWSKRLQLELEEHDAASFITLTYDNAPYNFVMRDVQLFLKRLRKRIQKKISYYLVGELGEKTRRVHYHAIIFGFWPDDALLYKTKPYNLYTSKILTDSWGLGHVVIGEVNEQTINYCTGYMTKDFGAINFVPETGEIIRPFMTCSKKPGIGRRYFERLDETTLIDRDYIYFKGSADLMPKYFNRLRNERLSEKEQLKLKRRKYSIINLSNKNLISIFGDEESLRKHRIKLATSKNEVKKLKKL